jgi:hypothetical protein
MDAKNLALTVLGKTLQSRGYRFVAMTPANHCRALDRPSPAATLESIFGWNRAFDRDALDPEIFDLMEHDEALEGESGRYKSKVRFATVEDLIFAHSGFPTAEPDAVPFGPDAYRFVRLLRASLADVPSGGPLRLVDIGSSAGLAELPRLGCSASTLTLCLATSTARRSRSAQSTRSQTYASADRLAAIGLTATKGG